jgi:hypothetical protein
LQHRSFLEYRRFRHLKLALFLCAFAIGAYLWHRTYHFHTPGHIGYGGSAMGYVLGTVSAMLILWLLWLGVRKRQYRASSSTLQGWLSAHVYLGLATLVVATLHSGFEWGVNLHGLTYLLLLIVVFSGIYGVVLFVRLPARMTAALGDDSAESLLLQMQEIDQQARGIALQMPDAFNALAMQAAQNTRLQESLLESVFRPVAKRCATARAVEQVQLLSRGLKDEQARLGRELFGLMLNRRAAVDRLRRELRSRARLRRWLVLHVPLSFALLAALVAHIMSVFVYW